MSKLTSSCKSLTETPCIQMCIVYVYIYIPLDVNESFYLLLTSTRSVFMGSMNYLLELCGHDVLYTLDVVIGCLAAYS